jgi:hypothetical protein
VWQILFNPPQYNNTDNAMVKRIGDKTWLVETGSVEAGGVYHARAHLRALVSTKGMQGIVEYGEFNMPCSFTITQP